MSLNLLKKLHCMFYMHWHNSKMDTVVLPDALTKVEKKDNDNCMLIMKT